MGRPQQHAFFSSVRGNEESISADPPPLADATTFLPDVAETVAENPEEHWQNVKLAMKLLETAHDYTGLPWWAGIAVVTVIVRTALFPLVIRTQKATARLTKAAPEISKLNDIYKSKISKGIEVSAVDHQARTGAVYQKYKANPFAPMLMPAVSMPIFLTFFFSLRAMAVECESFKSGGMLWFQDLSAADPYYVLPVLSSSLMALSIQLSGTMGDGGPPQMGMMKKVMTGVSFAIIPFVYDFPTAIFLYWISTNAFTGCQTLFLKQPAVKKFFDLPLKPATQPKPEDVNPYLDNENELEEMKAHQQNSIRYYEDATQNKPTQGKRSSKRKKKTTRR